MKSPTQLEMLKPQSSHVSYLDALGLHVFSQTELIQLLGVGHPIVAYNWIGQGQNLTSVTGVSQGLGIAKVGEQQEKSSCSKECISNSEIPFS